MTSPEAAANHLRAIRALMERATCYRAISAPAALAGGILALAAAGFIAWADQTGARSIEGPAFVLIWLVVFGICSLVNIGLLARSAERRGEPFVSPGMKLAVCALAPPLFVGGMLGMTQAAFFDEPDHCALSWILCYGLALLATASFAPRSIGRLGKAFVITGTVLLVIWHLEEGFPSLSNTTTGALFMGGTFGLLHLVYALAVGLTHPEPAQEADASTPDAE